MRPTSHPIPELDPKGLREFGVLTGAIVAGLFGVLFPWLLRTETPIWAWLVGGGLGLWGLAAPASLRPVYRAWMRLGLLLSRISTPLILGLVFFFLILPMGLVMRVPGRDPMARHLDERARSYRVPSRKAPKENMERPF